MNEEIIIGKQKLDPKGKPLKELKGYVCNFCKHKFKQYVRNLDLGKKSISTQVKCPNCNNFLKTW